MAKYKIAHIKEQGLQLIIAPLDSSFNSKTQENKDDFMEAFQADAASAGLAGRVVLIWWSWSMLHFMAPQPWHPFFRSRGTYKWIMANINKELTIN